MPKRNAKHSLHEVFLKEVSFVDDGDNPLAEIVIIKQNSGDEPDDAGQSGETDKEGVTMSAAINKALGLSETATEAEALAKIAEIEKSAKTAQDAFTASESKVTELTKSLADKDEEITKARGDESFVNIDGVSIFKSKMGESYEQLKSMDNRLQISEIEKSVATEYPHLVGGPLKIVDVLKSARRMPAAEQTAVTELVKRVNELTGMAIDKNGRKSNKADKETTAEVDLDKMAKEIMKSNPGLTYHQAFDKATQTPEGLEAIQKSRGEVEAD